MDLVKKVQGTQRMPSEPAVKVETSLGASFLNTNVKGRRQLCVRSYREETTGRCDAGIDLKGIAFKLTQVPLKELTPPNGIY